MPPNELYQQWSLTGMEKAIIEAKSASAKTYDYASQHELQFELSLRKEIVSSANALYRSGASFATFAESRCNDHYWELSRVGGFKLKEGVKPVDGINDIYTNGSKYAFECAVAMIIVYYKAVLESLNEEAFNKLFNRLYLFSWNYDEDLSLSSYKPADVFPGDVRYFKNPDVDPKTPEWQGENVVDLGNGMYYGHGIGIKNAAQMIKALNKNRKPGAAQSAFLMDQVTRPDFKRIAGFADTGSTRTLNTSANSYGHDKKLLIDEIAVKESICFDDYVLLLTKTELNTPSITIRIGSKTFKVTRSDR
jgi:protein-glutamine gamma-glutamyltransferase